MRIKGDQIYIGEKERGIKKWEEEDEMKENKSWACVNINIILLDPLATQATSFEFSMVTTQKGTFYFVLFFSLREIFCKNLVLLPFHASVCY